MMAHEDNSSEATAKHSITYMPPQRAASRDPKKREGASNVLTTIAILFLAPLAALLITGFIFQSYQVDGASMQTTLYGSDRLVIWKVPKTWSRITGNPYVPKRGDVIVFSESMVTSYGQGPGKQLIKRVIGLPGERVVIKDNTVTLYSQEHPEGLQPDKSLSYGKVITKTSGEVDVTVPKDSIFVLGDNRPDSLDSRAFGTVHIKDVVGKLVLRVWPAKEVRTF